MRRRSVATALVVLSAGVTAAALRRLAARRGATAVRTAVPTTVPTTGTPAPAPAVPASTAPAEQPVPDAVVLPFTRPAVVPAPAAPTRCGDSGGRTRAGAPCASRATAGGRCHHHRAAA